LLEIGTKQFVFLHSSHFFGSAIGHTSLKTIYPFLTAYKRRFTIRALPIIFCRELFFIRTRDIRAFVPNSKPNHETSKPCVHPKLSLKVGFNLTDYQAFLHRCKPSFLCDNDSDECSYLSSCNYPSAPVAPGETTIFFHSLEQRDRFASEMKEIELGSDRYYFVLGEALGFPPIAVKFFADFVKDRTLEKYGAVFNYAGRNFAGHIADTFSIADWLWNHVENYPPSKIKITFQGKVYWLYPSLPTNSHVY
jgi:hypothetical protein